MVLDTVEIGSHGFKVLLKIPVFNMFGEVLIHAVQFETMYTLPVRNVGNRKQSDCFRDAIM